MIEIFVSDERDTFIPSENQVDTSYNILQKCLVDGYNQKSFNVNDTRGCRLVAEHHICYFVNPIYVNGKWVNTLHEIKRRKYVNENTSFYTFEYVEQEVLLDKNVSNLLQPIFDNINNTENFINDYLDKINS